MRTDSTQEAPELQTGLSDADLAYLERMTRWLSRDAQEAEDIAQETWLAYHKSPPRDPEKNRQWLRVVARRIAARMRYQRDPARVLAEDPLDPSSLSTTTRRGEIQDVVGRAYRSLPEPYQSMVRMRFYEDLKPAHISERLGVSVNTVNSRLQRAQKMMRRKLEPERRGSLRWMASLVLAPFGIGERARTEGGSTLPAWGAAVAVGAALVGAGFLLTGDGSKREALAAPSTRTATFFDAGPTTPGEAPRDAARQAVDAPAAPATIEEVVLVTGLVLDESGRSLSGAEIYAWIDEDEARRVGTSGPDGTFRAAIGSDERLRGPIHGADGAIALQARAFGRSDGTVRVLPRDQRSDVPLVLGRQAAELVVRLEDGDGFPITDAALEYSAESADVYGSMPDGTLFWEPPLRAVPDGPGAWRFQGLPVGSGTITAKATGFMALRENLTIEAGHQVVRIECERGCAVVGRVLDVDGQPAAGVSFGRREHNELDDRVTYTDEDGVFRLANVRPGTAILQAFDAETNAGWERNLELTDEVLDLGVVTLEPRESHRFRLVDEDLSPLAGFTVQLRNPSFAPGWTRMTTTDADGWIEIDYAPYETIEVWPFAGELHPQAGFPVATFEVARGEEEVLTVPMSRLATWEIWSGISPGHATPGSFLRIRQLPKMAERRLRLPADGRLVLEVPRGRYFVTYFEPGTGEAVFGLAEVADHAEHRFYPPPPGRTVLAPELCSGVESFSLHQLFGEKSQIALAIFEIDSPPKSEYELQEGAYRLDLQRADGSERVLEFEVASGHTTTLVD